MSQENHEATAEAEYSEAETENKTIQFGFGDLTFLAHANGLCLHVYNKQISGTDISHPLHS